MRAEVVGAHHILTHLPKNPHCQPRHAGKLTTAYRHRDSFVNEAARWCEPSSADFTASTHECIGGGRGMPWWPMPCARTLYTFTPGDTRHSDGVVERMQACVWVAGGEYLHEPLR